MFLEGLHTFADFQQVDQHEGLQTLYIVRHCKAEGQSAEAPLTAEGCYQAQRLSSWLSDYSIDYIVSSPYIRAVQTLKPYAEKMNKTIYTDEGLAERVLSGEDRADWLQCLKRTFDEPDICYPGGESSRQATGRIVTVITELLKLRHGSYLVAAHGNIISLLLKHYDERIGFEHWKRLSNPDVYRITFFKGLYQDMERIWSELQS